MKKLPESNPLRNSTLFSQSCKSLSGSNLASSSPFRSDRKRKQPSTESGQIGSTGKRIQTTIQRRKGWPTAARRWRQLAQKTPECRDRQLGKTPSEVYCSRPPANERPRYETRKRWPRGSPCASPQVGIEGEPGDQVILEIDCYRGRRHLPILRARQAA